MKSLAKKIACVIHQNVSPSFLLDCNRLPTAMPNADVAMTMAAGYISPSTSSAPKKRCCSRYATSTACASEASEKIAKWLALSCGNIVKALSDLKVDCKNSSQTAGPKAV